MNGDKVNKILNIILIILMVIAIIVCSMVFVAYNKAENACKKTGYTYVNIDTNKTCKGDK